ncbi:MAG: WecB/TagA/CpsF family glycosyltransferase [Burkholderiales bacterium]|nr:WecB/TagA/CpsF family glycosyltransferase [Burkholderiales bacterium]MDP2398603.1 WecB/TagA/CpsF family glycosyltransferase [Burkholderiales bacterium]
MKPAIRNAIPVIDPAPRRTAAHVDFERKVYCLLGLPFDAVSMADAVRTVRRAAARRKACFMSTPNLNFLVGCRNDGQFRDSVIHSDLSIADGMPLVWIARMLRIPITERVSGAGLFEALRCSSVQSLSVYLFGGPEGAGEAACRRLNAEAGGMRCSGFAAPGFGSIDDMSSAATIAAINASRADFLLVALGAKKGQAWIEHNRARISVPVISHLGAVVNFVAGTVQRAPPWMQRSGLEWLWRIMQEPALWRRYLADGTALLRLLATRVLPNWLDIRRHAPSGEALDAAAIIMRENAGITILSLRGAWIRTNLGPLRRCFTELAAVDADIRIDMQDTTHVDAAFLGLILLLHGHQQMRGRRLSCHPLSPQSRRAFTLGCCEFLLDNG